MHGGNLRWAKEHYHVDEFIDLSANINPFGPPVGVFQRLQEALSQIVHYPDPESKALRLKLSQLSGIPYDMILAGNGAGELIYTLLQALRPEKVLIPVPAFSEYARAAAAVHANISYWPLGAEGWQALPDCRLPERARQVEQTWLGILNGIDLLFLCSPHNPTGSLLSPEGFASIMRAAERSGCLVIFDESFYDFTLDALRWSAREYLQEFPNLIVLYSLTKFYSLPGLRLGTVFAQPSLIRALKTARDPWSVNVLAQEAGLEALEDRDFPGRVREKLQESRAFFYERFTGADLRSLQLKPTQANFALIELKEGNAQQLTERLGRRGILVRDCSSFEGLEGEFIRVAIKDQGSMARLIQVLKAIHV
ncbi:MAG: threonine-phosphate decarboxylase CobD [Desulfitobacteriaceae bacterium]|nr:threonine-phosphate decarboxylase CobD [Desulfitobacteriaceae bacterium]MDI6879910.1 threonine-phosphate decarboxylase CobD [Desulfitobacteriaceae bacterium]MDI6915432.1 threonine-phosphate decarboxylase CobD [Desulfitobacteriaceae bacterium]